MKIFLLPRNVDKSKKNFLIRDKLKIKYYMKSSKKYGKNHLMSDALKNNIATPKRLIVVGTGFHRQILGDTISPLSSWSQLLKEVMENFGKREACRISDIISTVNDPVIQWEQIICNTNQNSKRFNIQEGASEAEKKLKQSVCTILNGICLEIKKLGIYNNNFLANKISNSSIHLLSLNFESLAYSHLNPRKKVIKYFDKKNINKLANEAMRKNEAKLLYDRFICKNHDSPSIVWHPHGHVGRVDSLILGMRDYGFLPPSYFYAFNQFKKWENKIAANLQGAEKYQKLIEELKLFDDRSDGSGITDPADNWVTRFMLYPLTFIGVGLSQVEIGMRWLLVQRARNFLHVPKDQVPVTEFYGTEDPGIPGLVWKKTDMKGVYDQMWNAALDS